MMVAYLLLIKYFSLNAKGSAFMGLEQTCVIISAC